MWSKLDHAFFRNPKTLTVGQDARLLYLAGVCYAGDRLTDGVIPHDALPLVAAEAQVVDVVTAVARLVAAGLWHAVTGGHRIHDFFDFNPNARQIKARREATRSRTAAYRARKKAVALHGSDGEIGDAVTRASPARSSQRTNVVKDSDSDSELKGYAPLPPTTPPVSVQPTERAQESVPVLPVPVTPLRAVPKPREVERAATESHPLFAPLVAVFGRPPASELRDWHTTLAALDELGALPDDIPRAAAGYSVVMGTDATGRPILLTRPALVRHWHRCLQVRAPAPGNPPARAPGDTRMPIHGDLDPAKYTGDGVYSWRPPDHDDDQSVEDLMQEMGIHDTSTDQRQAAP